MVFYAQCSREKDESWSGDAALFLQWTVIDTRKETLHDLLEPFESASPSDSLGPGLTTVEVGSAKEYQTVVAKALIHASYPKIESGLSCFTFTGAYSGYTRTFCFPFGTASEGLIRSSVHRHLVASPSEETYVWDRCFDRVCGCILSLGEKVSFPLVISASHGEDPRMEIRVSRVCVEVHGWKELRYSATPEKRSVGTDTEHLYDPSEHSVVTPHRNTSDSIDPQEALFAHQNKLFDRAHHAVMECGLFRLRSGHNEGKEGSTDDNPLSEMTVFLAIEEACVEEETARIRIETSWLETCIKLKVSLLTDLRRLGDHLVEPNQEIKIRCVSRLPSKEELKLHQTFNHVTKENLTYFTKMKEVEAMLTQVEQEKDAYNAKVEEEYSSLLDTLEELQSTLSAGEGDGSIACQTGTNW
ncbi:hypothetical protein ADEAN_000327600 [Angomonas deanei]|uniref:Uncharacterized protein n=1 Tax=Angomonas deanei TaxID=59799 RepID=A0A7G2C7N4_9TRYP|nr:hypothetical protein ADEAN_000327600 [Angomonas deanei]